MPLTKEELYALNSLFSDLDVRVKELQEAEFNVSRARARYEKAKESLRTFTISAVEQLSKPQQEEAPSGS